MVTILIILYKTLAVNIAEKKAAARLKTKPDGGDNMVGDGGFEPPKALPTDLQSAPFGHSGNLPYEVVLVYPD